MAKGDWDWSTILAAKVHEAKMVNMCTTHAQKYIILGNNFDNFLEVHLPFCLKFKICLLAITQYPILKIFVVSLTFCQYLVNQTGHKNAYLMGN